ncbi:MAG: NAD(P)H-dependent oxidoreductase [Muribaculaceae bacterium]|nr:NAD(P)H-dependent oxidoreductase [Muribaculaceae bacterium]
MKKIITSIFTLLAICLVACGSPKAGNAKEEKTDSKILVAYFSAQGHTKALAEKIAVATDGTLFEIQPENPYTEEDLDGWNESARGTRESKDRSTRPVVKNRVENFEQYDTIYLGFPIWWYTAPTIVNTFLEQYDTEGKVIIPFATSGGSPIGETEKDLNVSAPNATFLPGRVINDATQQEVNEWVKTVTEDRNK